MYFYTKYASNNMSACLDRQPQAQSMHLDAEVETQYQKSHPRKDS